MSNNPETFSTPSLRYLRMKKAFLQKFMDKKIWCGEFGSKDQVIVLTGVLEYFKMTSDLAKNHPEILNSVLSETKNLVLQKVLPLPPKLYEQLLLAVVEDKEDGYQLIWQQPDSLIMDKIISFFVSRRASHIAAYEDRMWSDVNYFENYTFDDKNDIPEVVENSGNVKKERELSKIKFKLRQLRNNVYKRISSKLKAHWQMNKYRSATREFLAKFETELSVIEKATFEKRVKVTEKAVKTSKIKYMKYLEAEEAKQRLSTQTKDSMSETEQSEEGSDVSEASIITEEPFNLDESLTMHSHDCQENKLLILPEVPQDTPEPLKKMSGDKLDEEIERRLSRLKFFSQTWALNKKKPSHTMIVTPAEIIPAGEEVETAGICGAGNLAISSVTMDLSRDTIDPSRDTMDLSRDTMDLSRDTLNLFESCDTMFQPRDNAMEIQDITDDYIREALDMICKTYIDTSYITMANDCVSGESKEMTEVLSSEEINKNTQFLKFQEEELLISLYNYQSYLVGLVIVCSYVSSQLVKTVSFLPSSCLTPDQDDVPPRTISIPSPPRTDASVSAPSQANDKGIFSRFLKLLKPLNTFSDGKKVEDLDHEISEAFEATEEMP